VVAFDPTDSKSAQLYLSQLSTKLRTNDSLTIFGKIRIGEMVFTKRSVNNSRVSVSAIDHSFFCWVFCVIFNE
jgi:hypothetical protein